MSAQGEFSGAPLRAVPPPGGSPAGYDRTPPSNLDAEVSVLGAMLLSRDAIADVSEVVGPEDFYRGAHRSIFEAARDLYDRGEPVDTVTLADELSRRGTLADVGGVVALNEIVRVVPTAANALYYARIVADHALRRRLIDAGTEITRTGYDNERDVAEVVDNAERVVFDVAQRRGTAEFTPMKELLNQSFELIEKLHEQHSPITGLATGFTDFDELTAGLQPSNLVIIAARPAMGKSTLVTNLAAHVAVELRQPAVLFSLEMSQMELVQRILAAEARVDSGKLRTGRLQDSDWPRLSQAMGRLAEAPLFIDDTAGINLLEIRSKCRRLKQKHGLSLVIIDYLQLMTAHRRNENRVQEVSEFSRGLKILAKELEVPVIALSQLSRRPEDRSDRRPQLSDLRESGCLPATARVVRADTGAETTMGELFTSGERNIPVLTVGSDFRVGTGFMTHVFSTGVKEVFDVRFASGRHLQATANHPLLTIDGWRSISELSPGSRTAVPRFLPPPAAAEVWAEEQVIVLAQLLGGGSRSADTFIPDSVFALKDPQVALFVRHLWATDGRLTLRGNGLSLYYASPSRRLVDDLQRLLLRFGIGSTIRTSTVGEGERYQLAVTDAHAQRAFLTEIGVHGPQGDVAAECLDLLRAAAPKADDDTIPAEIWTQVHQALNANAVTEGALQQGVAPHDSGASFYAHAPSRARLGRIAAVLDDAHLEQLATSDLLWDEIVSITSRGSQPVFDGTVPGTHNFIANNVVVENSIEQDADIVAFIYRDEVYDPETAAKGEAELIVSKHRNGALKTIRLSFIGHHSRFANMARGAVPSGGPPL